MKAKRCFTVRPRLPEDLGPLAGLATNLRWSWDRRTQSLFEQIDPGLWEETRHDPQKLLASVDPSRLDRLSRDADYVTRLTAAASDLEAHGEEPRWFERRVDDDNWPTAGRIAYFSPEFGISEAILQYSGGLGVLAGDHVKAASDLGLPLVAIGLFYRHGYFRQELSVDGWQHERFADVDPHALALEQCDDVKVELDGFALDEITLANSSMLPYLAMVATVIEKRAIGVEELLHLLRRSMRQRSFDRLPRREYVLGFLNRHPP